MTIIPLSDSEWEEINAQLLDIQSISERIFEEIPHPDWLQTDYEQEWFRSSNVCLRDAGRFLNRARLALKLALGVRKYHISKSHSKNDEAWFDAHFESQFYAEYVPLLLCATSEHALNAIAFLFGLAGNEKEYRPGRRQKIDKKYFAKGKDEKNYYLLASIRQSIDTNPSASLQLKNALEEFDVSSARKATWDYRNNWVHNKPTRVETPFFDPPRKRTPYTEIIIGATFYQGSEPIDYTWDKLIDLLKQSFSDSHKLLSVCLDEWVLQYERIPPLTDGEDEI